MNLYHVQYRDLTEEDKLVSVRWERIAAAGYHDSADGYRFYDEAGDTITVIPREIVLFIHKVNVSPFPISPSRTSK